MDSDLQTFRKKAILPSANQMGKGFMHIPVESAIDAVTPAVKHLTPHHSVELQPSEVCPRNFIIFDQTDHRSQIMFNPAFAQKFDSPYLNIHATYFQDNFERKKANNERDLSSPLEEDSGEINALLSLDEEVEEECDEEEVSTARTDGNYGSSSPDSCSSCSSKPRRNNRSSSSIRKSSGSSSCSSERKRQKMKKMVKALRGIVPGGNQMNTVAVLDEAVTYLKSLKVEVQKLGVGNLKN